MKKVRITSLKQTIYQDLIDKYENKLDNPCDVKLGSIFISIDAKKPDGLCPSAWDTMKDFVYSLSIGKGNFYDGWMKNPNSAMISCNDGFRPMTFLLEVIEED